MAPRVSVVIPVYNVGKQLETCLQSVVGQTFTDLEIVVVNDGSTDDSPQIVARFARQDPRIVIIDRPNEGVAYARKHGVEAAREILNGDPNVAAENKYMIILSDGAARVWINEDGESVAQLHVANNWNTTSILSTTWRS